MKIEEIRGLKNEDIIKHISTFQKELFHLRFQLASQRLTNNQEIKWKKRMIARLKTVFKENQK